MPRNKSKLSIEKALPYILLVGSIICLVAAFALTYDKIQVLKDGSYKPSCNINPILSCGSVMEKPQANLFGVPNTIYGLMGFSALLTLSVLTLAKVKFPRWIWQGLQVGLLGGMFFAYYLFFQGIFRIKAICPFCFLVWISIWPMFWYAAAYNVRQGHLSFGKKVNWFIEKFRHDVLILWYVALFGILLVRFWYYWSTLL